MSQCQECGALFTPPSVPECVSEFAVLSKMDQLLCPEHLAVWRAAQDQREAEAQDKNRAVCAVEGHAPSSETCPEMFCEDYCLRCGVKEKEMA